MAAGRGQRMMPLTIDTPKAMMIHDGSTLIANGIERLKNFIEDIHITVGYKGAMLAKHVIEHNVRTVFNTDGRGNAWWIFNTLLKHVDEPVLVLTCDNVVELDADKLIQDYFAKGGPACMVVPVTPVDGLEGDYIFHNDGIVTELNRNKPSEFYCSGIQIINPLKINKLVQPSENFYNVWNELIKLKELKCSSIHPKNWFTVDTMEQLDALNRDERNRIITPTKP
jgi:NDP-sugar pyrophosphorylase family protein